MEHIKFNHPKKSREEKPEEVIVLPEIDAIKSTPLTELKKQKKYIEHLKEYQEYQGEKVNLEMLDRLPKEIDELHIDKERRGSIQATKDILSAHIENIKTTANNYYQKIESTETLGKIQKERLEETDFEDWLHAQDKHRGQIHDALIDSLKILTRFCVNQNEHLKVQTLFSLTGAAFPQNKLFSAAELNDRGFVGDWAFRVEKGRKMKEIHDLIEKQITEEGRKKPE
ncbi:MAG: DUF3232 domain-containing protein [Candidatus Lloydbacteria bacterium]|nr:DUF3232 domain-containing protein [Candidatus Lloydbacteria bacterium]